MTSYNLDQRLLDRPAYASGAVATDGANKTKVTLTLHNHAGAPVPYGMFDVYLSDSTAGAGLTGTTASGNVENDGTSGADFATLTSKKALRVQANSAGVYALSITDAAKTAFKVCTIIDGLPAVVKTLAAASYG